MQESYLHINSMFKSGQAVGQIARRNYGVCILGGIQTLTSHVSGQPAQANPASAGRAG